MDSKQIEIKTFSDLDNVVCVVNHNSVEEAVSIYKQNENIQSLLVNYENWIMIEIETIYHPTNISQYGIRQVVEHLKSKYSHFKSDTSVFHTYWIRIIYPEGIRPMIDDCMTHEAFLEKYGTVTKKVFTEEYINTQKPVKPLNLNRVPNVREMIVPGFPFVDTQQVIIAPPTPPPLHPVIVADGEYHPHRKRQRATYFTYNNI